MTRDEAEDFVYKSYLKAERFQEYQARDAMKRHPQFSREIIQSMQGTPCVVVTGSKGKGSISCMISQIMQTEKKVGMMTSPHIGSFRERFRVNGKSIFDVAFVRHIEKIKGLFDQVESRIPEAECVSPMGIQAALALSYFHEEGTDFNIFECGKGAKYDDVNNIVHQYAIINTIFLEHTRELGATLAEIAEDKANVITGNCRCVFVAEQKPEPLAVIEKQAAEKKVPLKIYGRDFRSENIRYTNTGMVFDVIVGTHTYRDMVVPLLGEHQAKNCAMAMAFCEEVLGILSLEEVKEKLKKLSWPGRMEVLSAEPFLLLDACINRESCHNVKKVLKELGISKITAIIGIPDDKDYLGVVESMQEVSEHVILTKSQNSHYIFTGLQMDALEKEDIKADRTLSIKQAMQLAREYQLPTVILGTTSLVSEVKMLIKTQE
ncbi:MAG TPA: Mur ligase family protein [Lachnospiraceae bacterium]|nr:Mur ligase family protein [Lachnospiraceae bacterium]